MATETDAAADNQTEETSGKTKPSTRSGSATKPRVSMVTQQRSLRQLSGRPISPETAMLKQMPSAHRSPEPLGKSTPSSKCVITFAYF